MKISLLAFIVVSIFPMSSFAGEIVRPFLTDLCTGYREGTRREPRLWEHCCRKHDLYLWAGGNHAQRNRVDHELRECVLETGEEGHASLIWLGVRLGSFSPVKIPGKQWGNAWGNLVRRDGLSMDEIARLEESLKKDSDLTSSAISEFARDLEIRNTSNSSSVPTTVEDFDTGTR